MGQHVSKKISATYIEPAKAYLNNNISIIPKLAIIDVDKIDEFLYEETEWSEGCEMFSEVFCVFLKWIKHKYGVEKYNQNVFYKKMNTKREITRNVILNLRLKYKIDDECFRL